MTALYNKIIHLVLDSQQAHIIGVLVTWGCTYMWPYSVFRQQDDIGQVAQPYCLVEVKQQDIKALHYTICAHYFFCLSASNWFNKSIWFCITSIFMCKIFCCVLWCWLWPMFRTPNDLHHPNEIRAFLFDCFLKHKPFK